MTKETILRDWASRHGVTLLDKTPMRVAHHYPVELYDFFKDERDYNYVTSHSVLTDYELTIRIRESELEKISDFENMVFNNLKNQGHYNFFNIVMQQKEEEKQLRNAYPAVQKAYEQYSLMLTLAKSGQL